MKCLYHINPIESIADQVSNSDNGHITTPGYRYNKLILFIKMDLAVSDYTVYEATIMPQLYIRF